MSRRRASFYKSLVSQQKLLGFLFDGLQDYMNRRLNDRILTGRQSRQPPVASCDQWRTTHDSKMIDCFLNWSKPPLAIVADKAYGSARIRREIEDEGALSVIPTKANARNPFFHQLRGQSNDRHLLFIRKFGVHLFGLLGKVGNGVPNAPFRIAVQKRLMKSAPIGT